MTTMTRTRNRAELLKAVQACQTTEEAHGLVTNEIHALRTIDPNLSEERCRTTVLNNIGYVTGDGIGRPEAGRLLKLFGVEHPYFGKIENWPATPEAIFRAGWDAGMKSRSLGGDGEGETDVRTQSGLHQG